MNQRLRKSFCPNWCPKKLTDCNFECYEWEENGNISENEYNTDPSKNIKN